MSLHPNSNNPVEDPNLSKRQGTYATIVNQNIYLAQEIGIEINRWHGATTLERADMINKVRKKIPFLTKEGAINWLTRTEDEFLDHCLEVLTGPAKV